MLGLATLMAAETNLDAVVAWCHCNEVHRCSPLDNAASLLVKQCMGCAAPVGEAKISSDPATKKKQREGQIAK